MLTEQQKIDFKRTIYLLAYVLLIQQYREIQDSYQQFLDNLNHPI